jgi:hypothetical protein
MRNPPFQLSRERLNQKKKDEKEFLGPGYYEERRNLKSAI